MKKHQPDRMTLRFRKWSRKAYAAFASLNRCVTIGCLPKSVADCSLKKHKAGSAAGNKSGSFVEANDGKAQETDIGVPYGCGIRLETVLEIIGLGAPQVVLCPVSAFPCHLITSSSCQLQKLSLRNLSYILNRYRTRMARTAQRLYIGFALFASFVFLNEGDRGDEEVITPLTPSSPLSPKKIKS